MEWLEKLSLDQDQLLALRTRLEQRHEQLKEPRNHGYAEAAKDLPPAGPNPVTVEDGCVNISMPDHPSLQQRIEAFIPWKKGPFRLGDTMIDAEWRSEWKWHRLLPHLGNLSQKRIADIGCHNGYYMFRMAEHEPEWVLGIEPVAKHYYCFELLNHFAQQDNLDFGLLGIEDFHLLPGQFDIIFCLGILYHLRDPITALGAMRKALRPGGKVIIDCQGIPGEEPYALIPASRYAGASGMWYLPTLSALQNQVRRSGFSRQKVLYSGKLEPTEQRSTPWAPVRSLEEFLDPVDQTKTIEGYPAPWRFYLEAKP